MIKSAPSFSAASASSVECVDAPMRRLADTILRTTVGFKLCVVRWTPSAPTARAMSVLSFMNKFDLNGFMIFLTFWASS